MAEDLGSIYSEIRVRFDKLDKDIAKVDTKFNTLKKQSDANANNVKNKWTTSFNKIGLAGVASITAITVALKSAVKIGATFEQSIANVGSVASGSAADLKILEDAAKEAGETTRFTASEAADALYSLASAGLDAKDSVSALDGVLMFAGATQSDLATSSALIVSTLKQYNLEASKATDVSNILAAGIGNSLATMDKFKLALQQAGPVAGALNINLEQTVGALEALFDAGYTGEKAGTALRNVYSYLADSTSEVSSKLVDMGADIEKINPQFTDLADIIDYLNELGLDTGQIFAAFGNEVGGQMVSLMSAGGDAIRDYTEAVTDTNSAFEMYIQQNDTLLGSFDRMKSALEGVAISLTEKLTPALSKAFDFVARLANKVTGSNDEMVSSYENLQEAVENYNKVLEDSEGKTDAVTQAMVSQAKAALNLALQKASEAYAESNKSIEKYNSTIEKSTKWIDRYNESLAEIAKGTGYTADQLNVMTEQERHQTIALTKGVNEADRYNTIIIARQGYQEDLTAATIALSEAEASEESFVNTLTQGYLDQNEVAMLLLDTYPELKQTVLDNVAAYKAQKEAQAEAIAEAQEAYDQIKNNQDLTDKQLADAKAIGEYWLENALSAEEAAIWTKYLAEVNERLTGTEEEGETAVSELAESTEEYRKRLEEVGKTSQELRDLERARAIEEAKASEGTADEIQALVDSINDYYDALDAQDVIDANKELEEQNKTIKQQIEEIGASEEELREIEKQRAIDLVNASDADNEYKREAIALLEEYYDKLADDEATTKAEENMEDLAKKTKQMWQSTADEISTIFSNLSSLFSAISDARIEALEAEMNAELKAKGLAEQTDLEEAKEEYNEQASAIQGVSNAYDEAIAAAKASGDAATVASLEAQKAAQQKADAETLAEYQAAVDKAAIEEEYAKEKAQIEYRYNLLSWKAELAAAIASGANSILKTMSAYPYPFNIPLVAAQTTASGLQIAAISASKPQAPALATGGIILPTNGGVTTVQAENGYGELSLNAGPSGESLLNDFANRIASQISGSSSSNLSNLAIYLEMDSKIVSQGVAKNINNGTVRIKLK
jgi:TP901 family phage tail tape measure protein